MSIFRSAISAAIISVAVAGCATVRQQDLDAWVGVPVEALDTHPLFLTIPMYRTQTDSGIEIRNYVNSKDVEQCFTHSSARNGDNKYVNYSAFTSCSNTHIACNNLFYIQGGKVTRYAPTGSCYTDDSVRPSVGYLGAKTPTR